MILKTDTMENTVGFEQGSTYMQFSDRKCANFWCFST